MSFNINSIRDIFKEDYIGITGSDNIQDFPTQGVSGYNNNEFVEIGSIDKKDQSFKPKTIIFFDSVVRLDFVLMFRPSVVGFITIVPGLIKVESNKPVELSKSVEYEVLRYLIAPRSVLNDRIVNGSVIEIEKSIKYTIYPIEPEISKVSELWDKYVLEILLQNIEIEFITKKIDEYSDNQTIFVKDGNLQGLNVDSPSVFGHVKTFDIPTFLLNDDIIIRKSETSKIYKNNNLYSCYINYGYNRKTLLGKTGTFNFSRLDMLSSSTDDKEVISRFNFITRYLLNMTSVFSDSPRFPQNLPVIEMLEKFLRSVSGEINIIRHRIVKNLNTTY
ncbi:MAG: hypothetical protein RMJ37_01565 [Spirochaetia bacterium]|nr:hypothetical protein [Spirochaetota bacterium]MCX8097350.1 hypothetical protein [Spirochaetota bacterium]MDW8112011.1 hypothetical protein [Spirochaetia bacterium]